MIYQRVSNLIRTKFHLDPDFLIKNSFWINVEWVLSRLVKVLFNIFIVRQLSVKMYGDYSYILSVIGVLTLFSLSGFYSTILREISRKNLLVFKEWVELGFKFSLIGSLILIIIAALKNTTQPYIAISLILAAIFFPFLYKYVKWDALLFGMLKFRQRTFFTFIKNISTYFPLAVVILLFKENLVIIIFAYLVVTLIADFFIYRRSTRDIRFLGSSSDWIKSGASISISSGLAIVYSYIDKIILFNLLGPAPLAIYVVATYIPENLKIVTSNNLRMYFPKMWAKDNAQVKEKLRKVKWLLLLYPLGIFIAAFIATPFIIDLFFGKRYIASIRFAQIYALILPLHFYYLLFFSWYIKIQKEKHIVLSSILSAVVTLLAYFILVPRYGIIGAVIGSIIYYFSKLVYFLILYICKHIQNSRKVIASE